MLAKCANPDCSEVFRYLGSGKLYRTHSQPERQANASPLEHFWLCANCVKDMTVAVERGGRVIVIPRDRLEPYRETIGKISPARVVTSTEWPNRSRLAAG